MKNHLLYVIYVYIHFIKADLNRQVLFYESLQFLLSRKDLMLVMGDFNGHILVTYLFQNQKSIITT